jgi:hypothetical protein
MRQQSGVSPVRHTSETWHTMSDGIIQIVDEIEQLVARQIDMLRSKSVRAMTTHDKLEYFRRGFKIHLLLDELADASGPRSATRRLATRFTRQ